MNIPNDMYTQISRLVYTMFSDIVWSNNVREDLVSDSVFEYVVLVAGHGEESAGRQLSTMIRNNVTDYLRSARRHREILVEEIPEIAATSQSTWELLNDISAYLTVKEVELVQMRMDGFTQTEIAKINKTYQKDISRKIEVIKEKLERYHEEITGY